jgi:hypothetical protein
LSGSIIGSSVTLQAINQSFQLYFSTSTANPPAASMVGVATLAGNGGVINATNWTGIAFGNGVFVAVTAAAVSIMSSPDGINWTFPAFPSTPSNWNDVIFAGGQFVAVGIGKIMTSSDGMTWTLQTLPAGPPATTNWAALAYGNGTYVCVANTGTGDRTMSSPDGINWTSHPAAAALTWSSLSFGNNMFIAGAASGLPTTNTIMTSTDNGVTWTQQTHPSLPGVGRITWMGTEWLGQPSSQAASGPWPLLHSTDGINWTLTTETQPTLAPFVNGQFIRTSGSGILAATIQTSPDLINWTDRGPSLSGIAQFAYGNGTYVGIGQGGPDRLITSPDSINWTWRVPSPIGIASISSRFTLASAQTMNLILRTISTGLQAFPIRFWGSLTAHLLP